MKMLNSAWPVAAVMLVLPAARSQEPPAARAQFEVASLKPNPGCENVPRAGNLSPSPGRLEMPCVTLAGLLQVRLRDVRRWRVHAARSDASAPGPPKPGDPPPNLCGVMMMGFSGKGDAMIEVRGRR